MCSLSTQNSCLNTYRFQSLFSYEFWVSMNSQISGLYEFVLLSTLQIQNFDYAILSDFDSLPTWKCRVLFPLEILNSPWIWIGWNEWINPWQGEKMKRFNGHYKENTRLAKDLVEVPQKTHLFFVYNRGL